jgi:hypothetical protein
MHNTIRICLTERIGESERNFDVSVDMPQRSSGLNLIQMRSPDTGLGIEGRRFAVPANTAAPKGRTRNPDGTVTDHATGLQWSATLTEDGDTKRFTYAEAEKAVAALGEGWRLPTRRELLDLVDDTRSEPAIDASVFTDTESAAYWTGTPWAGSPSVFAWFVYFFNGDANYYHRYGNAFVRAVRSVSSPGQ